MFTFKAVEHLNVHLNLMFPEIDSETILDNFVPTDSASTVVGLHKWSRLH
jgi:hypothetical protein